MEAAKTHNWEVTQDAQDKLAVQDGSPELPVYTYDAFVQYLVRFIVADDQVSASQSEFNLRSSFRTQSLRVVDCPEFRDICLLLRPNLERVPHRDSIRERVTVEWAHAFTELRDRLAVSQFPGQARRIVLTYGNRNRAVG